jgi:hypothetical protein
MYSYIFPSSKKPKVYLYHFISSGHANLGLIKRRSTGETINRDAWKKKKRRQRVIQCRNAAGTTGKRSQLEWRTHPKSFLYSQHPFSTAQVFK